MPLDSTPLVEAVRVNGVALERADGLEIDVGSAAGWAYDPNGILPAMIRR